MYDNLTKLQVVTASINSLAPPVLSDSLNLSKVDIAGHSYGGHIATMAFKRMDNHARHLIVITPAGMGFQRIISMISKPPGLSSLSYIRDNVKQNMNKLTLIHGTPQVKPCEIQTFLFVSFYR